MHVEPLAREDSLSGLNASMNMAPPRFDQEGMDRILQHGLHEENVFNERFNFFLVNESLLLAGYGAFVGSSSFSDKTANIVCFFSLALTFAWWYVLLKQKYHLDAVRVWLSRSIPEFADLENHIRESREKRWLARAMRLRIRDLMGYGFPGAFICAWIILAINGL